MPKSGGGGNRTRVPRYFHVGFYVRSRKFGVSRAGPDRQGSQQASREQFLVRERARHDSRPSGFDDRLLDLSGEAPQSGTPMLGGQSEITLGN